MTNLALGPSWLDPDFLINTFGPVGILAIVFAESGLLIGFFLPGDSLLFTTGLLIVTDQLDMPLWLMCLLIVLAAVLGDQAGYLFGKKVGPALFRRPDSRLFKQENVEKAHEFFEKHGPKSLVLARFVPVVRTFTPIIAGVSGMRYGSFVLFNVIGGTLWGAGVTLLGAALGQIDFVHEHIELILVGIVLLSVVPIVIEYLRNRGKGSARNDASSAAPAPDEAHPQTPGAPTGDHGHGHGHPGPGYGPGPAQHPGNHNAHGAYAPEPGAAQPGYGAGRPGAGPQDPNAPYGHGPGRPQQPYGPGAGNPPGAYGPGPGYGAPGSPGAPGAPGAPGSYGQQGHRQGPNDEIGAPYGDGAPVYPGPHDGAAPQDPYGRGGTPQAPAAGDPYGGDGGPHGPSAPPQDPSGPPRDPSAPSEDPSGSQNRPGRGRHARR
ncbi:VTT domain-containing protein [Streptomyces diacarni]|uniref:DedA family protein n=1 Tax=Streptomyces diacarni TaxID=2800381 RepID=A0A367EG13_9ACTN|nr:DedA family protein [Streptomyces diacarni]RCG16893.1 DedA family protein [Streptomyces diacarni]